jgi:hypothetical protein
MSTITDYAGRTVDLLAFQAAQTNGVAQLVHALVMPSESGNLIAGVNKLAQRWLIEMLTEAGSIPYLPTRGTILMRELRLGRVRNAVDAEQTFYFAANEAKQTLLAEESTTTPDDESYGSVVLNSAVVSGSALVLRVTLNSLAGTSRTVLLPIDTRIG